jgi:type IX secretion system PorP/SprF family membrane protein
MCIKYTIAHFLKSRKRGAIGLFLGGFLLLAGETGFSQDLHFSQFFEAPLLRNPSLAGLFTGDIRVQMVYRDQWNSFTNAYKSGSFNGEYKAPVGKGDDFLTLGLQVLYDKAGTVGLTTTNLLPALNYHKSLSGEKRNYLSFGFMGGLVQKRIDQSKISTSTSYNTGGASNGEIIANPSLSYFDGSFGVSFNSSFGSNDANSYFLGAAYHHFNRPSNSFYRTPAEALNPKYVFSGGLKFNIDEYAYFTLQADQSLQGNFQETIGGVLYSYRIGDDPANPLYTIHGGAFIRWKDALIPVVKIDYNPFSVALSYDVNISELKTVSQGRGGVELSISYIGFLDRDNSSRYKVLCPRF